VQPVEAEAMARRVRLTTLLPDPYQPLVRERPELLQLFCDITVRYADPAQFDALLRSFDEDGAAGFSVSWRLRREPSVRVDFTVRLATRVQRVGGAQGEGHLFAVVEERPGRYRL